MDLLPQEIEVWYVLPALRKELAKAFLKKGKKQKDIAMLLKITQAAVSHYVKDKRGAEVDFPKEIQVEIEKSADRIMENPEEYLTEVLKLSRLITKNKVLCDIHRSHDKEVESKCDICFEKQDEAA